MRLASFLLAGLCVCFPHPTKAQDAEFASGVDAVTLAEIRPVLDAAARDSLPMDALRSKVLEGGMPRTSAGNASRCSPTRHCEGRRPSAAELSFSSALAGPPSPWPSRWSSATAFLEIG